MTTFNSYYIIIIMKQIGVKTTCKTCKTTFYSPKGSVKKGYGKYCSSECFGIDRWKNPTKEMLENLKHMQEIARNIRKGSHHTQETKNKISKSRIGKNLNNKNSFKRGYKIDKDGYKWILINKENRTTGSYVKEHRLVMEQFLGRKLEKGEAIHHKNEDKLDNRIENLQLVKAGAHWGIVICPRCRFEIGLR